MLTPPDSPELPLVNNQPSRQKRQIIKKKNRDTAKWYRTLK
jgi:hypothetical protein